MNRLIAKRAAGLLVAACVMVSPCALATSISAGNADGPVDVLTNLQYNSATLGTSAMSLLSSSATQTMAADPTTLNIPGWSFGSQSGGTLLVAKTTPPPVSGDSSYALEAVYPASTTGAQYTWANFSVASLNTEDVYIEFWAKMPDAKEGCKFLKIFGKRSDPEGDADTTFGPDYTASANHGGFDNVGFGDGSGIRNDYQDVIDLDGANPTYIGASYGIAKVLTPQMSDWPASNWGTSWHHFKVHVKFNGVTSSGQQMADGEIYIAIDGKVYVDATGLYNRNPENGPIDYIEFGGWAQTDPEPFDVWFDNITISTGGFVSDSSPTAPTNVTAN